MKKRRGEPAREKKTKKVGLALETKSKCIIEAL